MLQLKKIPKFKQKGMKPVLSKSAMNNAARCDDGVDARMNNSNPSISIDPTRSVPLVDGAPHVSIPSSLGDSNHNEKYANPNNSTGLENIQPVSEAVNLNTSNLRYSISISIYCICIIF